MKDVNCRGTETDIQNCSYSGWSVNDCKHSEDVGVDCCKFTSKNNYIVCSDIYLLKVIRVPRLNSIFDRQIPN